MKKIYIYLSFVPFFLIVFGFGSYNQHFKLIENPLSSIPNEQWVQESPIQFFIGFFINLFIKNPSISYWSSVVIGFVYLFFAIAKFEKNYLKNTSIAKILFFSPLFLILFYQNQKSWLRCRWTFQHTCGHGWYPPANCQSPSSSTCIRAD